VDRGTLMQSLKGTNFPAEKEEVASNAESQNALQDLVSQIRNTDTERFESAEEVMQALQVPSDVAGHP
jgi:hypothetical protein